jgi:predicted transposase/invertase (TIGR01784 family)
MEGQLLPLTSDYVFKRIFGQEENKQALKDFLESILEEEILKIEIKNPEIPKNFYDSKYGVLDLKVTLNDKSIVDVEMQMKNEHNIEQRDTFYLASNYVNELKEGEPYTNCKKSIVINILNFMYYNRNEYHSVARMIFEEAKEEEKVEMGYKEEDRYMTKYLEVHIIELPKFKIKNPKMHTKLEEWLWLFIGSDEKVSEASKKNKEIEKIKKKLASMSLSPEERNNYEYRLRAIRDEADAIEYKTKQAKEEGIKEGFERGIEQGLEQTAKEMLKNNFTIEQIETITKLTKEEIERLKKELKVDKT